MKITALDALEKIKVEMEGAVKVWKQVPISKNDGSPSFSFRVFTIEPNGNTPYHRHPFEHINYVIEGYGILVEGDGQEYNIKTGDFALVLPVVKHQYKNKSATEPLVIICAVPKEYE